MLKDTQTFIFFSTLALLLYWLLPMAADAKRRFLIITSLVFVFYLAPYACLWVIGSALTMHFLSSWLSKSKSRASFVFSLLIASTPLLYCRFIPDLTTIGTLGLTFLTLKNFTIVIDSFLLKQKIYFEQICTTFFFFPTYTSGPIEQYQTFSKESFQKKFSLLDLSEGLLRILFGLFKSLFICGSLLSPVVKGLGMDIENLSTCATYGFILLNFALIYINFSGYSDIAIGLSRLFGLKISENFNHPYMAKNITEFWQRWHMTMGLWCINNIYKNIVRQTGKVFLPMLFTFLFVGFWHNLSWNYAIWGLCHGLLLAAHQYITRNKRKWKNYQALTNHVAYQWLCRVAVIFGVSFLSAFANSDSLDKGWLLINKLIGG